MSTEPSKFESCSCRTTASPPGVVVPQVGAAVVVLVEFDLRELAALEEFEAAPCLILAAGDFTAGDLAAVVLRDDLELAVLVFVELLDLHVTVGIEGVTRVDIAVVVAIFLLHRLLARAVLDEGVLLAVAGGVGFTAELGVAVVFRHDVGLAVAVLILFFADALAVLRSVGRC